MSAPPPSTSRGAGNPSAAAGVVRWLQSLRPARTRINARERWRIVIGAFLGILLTGVMCHLAGGAGMASLPWLVAPMGASAVLVFGVPSSPLAQPWPVVGGNTLSALVGIACARWLGPPELAAAVAVGAAIGLMLALRCLHPPGGASALMMVLGGITNPAFALFPVLLNSTFLALAGMAYNNATRRPYPHAQRPAPAEKPPQVLDAEADLDAVLARYNRVLDVSRDDLQALLEQMKWQAFKRKLAGVRCADIMSRDLVTVTHSTPLEEAWALLRERRIKALPVVDADFRIVGIVTLADFMRAAELQGQGYQGMDARLRKLLGAIGASGKPPVVGQIMTRQVRVAGMHRYLVDLVPLFGGSGHHHLPIIGDDGRLAGIITQSDMVAALFEPPAPPALSTP
ncbi:MAG: HPP family protein [Polaromonas sp.]|nr:HPP family protein [Polaromonas sp.]